MFGCVARHRPQLKEDLPETALDGIRQFLTDNGALSAPESKVMTQQTVSSIDATQMTFSNREFRLSSAEDDLREQYKFRWRDMLGEEF